jgi:hypothetical protein
MATSTYHRKVLQRRQIVEEHLLQLGLSVDFEFALFGGHLGSASHGPGRRDALHFGLERNADLAESNKS